MNEMFPPDLPRGLLPVTGVWEALARGVVGLQSGAVATRAAVLVIEAVRQEAAPGVRLHELRLEVGHV